MFNCKKTALCVYEAKEKTKAQRKNLIKVKGNENKRRNVIIVQSLPNETKGRRKTEKITCTTSSAASKATMALLNKY
jgi:hypothetical protein